ncbi:hypothetical protein F5884DRAFT_509026 [Xylogone sp. PMI_703]|nr:hypothetical protein F5884DRAFT_509026 [Xylogone sp. PMI_703]
MQGHLRHLEGRCTVLQKLILRSSGQGHDGDSFWSDAIDNRRYKEYASFIGSVKGTLRDFVFEQGLRQEEDCHPGYAHPYNPPRQTGIMRPMDKRFLEYILPVLIEGPWPVLKTVQIFGLGGKPLHHIPFIPPNPQIFGNTQRQLATALGSCVLLVVEENSRKWLWSFDRHSPTYAYEN